MQFLRTAAAHLLRVSVCAVVLYCAALMALRLSGLSFVTVVSESMSPALHRGDLVVISSTKATVHEIALFERDQHLVIHRLVRTTPDNQWVTRGDANDVDDPWKIPTRDIHGVARYVIRGFGFPLMAWQSAIASFTQSLRATASAKSAYWTQAQMTWKIFSNSFYITTKSPNFVSMSYASDRKIWSAQSFGNTSHFHLFGKLSAMDPGAGGFHVMLNSCVSAADVVSCGLALTFNNALKKIQLHTYANGNFTADWISTPLTFSLTQDHHYSVYRGANSLQLQVDGEMYFNISDLAAKAIAAHTTVPSGTWCGVWLSGTNRITDARINFW